MCNHRGTALFPEANPCILTPCDRHQAEDEQHHEDHKEDEKQDAGNVSLAAEIPVKPKKAAINETMRKISAHFSSVMAKLLG